MRLLTRSVWAVLICSALVAPAACGGPPPSAPSDMLNQKIAFELPSDTGQLVSVPVKSGTTVLDFFSPACKPCKESVPALYAKKADIESKGGRLLLVGVLSDSESTDDARRALASWGVTAPFLVDRGAVAQSQAGVRDLPATLVLDRDGRLRWVAPPRAKASDVVAAVP